MPRAKKTATSPRKLPRQERSARLVEAILKAAIRVLEQHGAAGFTTIRVAERAGVSVGSLYQYFPNKQAILFRLQTDEWQTTADMLKAIFDDAQKSAATRLRDAMVAFFRSEVDEAPLRRALEDAAPLYRDQPDAEGQKRRSMPALLSLIDDVAPGLPITMRVFAAELFIASMGALGKHVSESRHTPAEVDAWAHATADMFLAYLGQQRSSFDARS